MILWTWFCDWSQFMFGPADKITISTELFLWFVVMLSIKMLEKEVY